DLSVPQVFAVVTESELSTIFEWDWRSGQNFFKTFLAGIFITIAMNGLDQNIMQKNLTISNTGDAQKNILWFSITFFIATVLFLSLGVLLYQCAITQGIGIPGSTDGLYPMLALNPFGAVVGVDVLLGGIAVACSGGASA